MKVPFGRMNGGCQLGPPDFLSHMIRRLIRRAFITALFAPLFILLLMFLSNGFQRRALVGLFHAGAGIEEFKATLGEPTCEFAGNATNACRPAWELFRDGIEANEAGRYYYWAIESIPYYSVVVGISTNSNHVSMLGLRVNQKTTLLTNPSEY